MGLSAHLRRVWKVGSRWSQHGTPESSILDLFQHHRVVFVGSCQDRFAQVSEGDLMLVSDGTTVVAMGAVTTPPQSLESLAIPFTPEELERFDFEPSVMGCKIDFIELREADREPYRMGTFHEVHQDADGYRKLYRRYHAEYVEGGGFEILARSCTLARNAKSPDDILWRTGTTFEIPVFQRPYSWGEPEISRLLNDLLTAFFGRLGGPAEEPVFIGTMQIEAATGSSEPGFVRCHNIIDGQQRLTTLILLLRALSLECRDPIPSLPGDYHRRIRTKIGGKTQQGYFDEAMAWDGIAPPRLNELNAYIRNLVTIRGQLANDPDLKETGRMAAFAEYVLSRVCFVVIETRAGLSKTLQIFNAINTAGMDLNGGDVFKIRFYEYLRSLDRHSDEKGVFDRVAALYTTIDEGNKAAGKPVTSMEQILSIARHYVATEASLAQSTRLTAGPTFFDHFFDVSLAMGERDGFHRQKCRDFRLTVELFEQLIALRFDWERIWAAFRPEARAMNAFIWWSRYSAYYDVLFLFSHRFAPKADEIERFTIAFSKLLLIHSLLYERITTGRKAVVHDLLALFAKSRTDETPQSVVRHIETVCATKRAELLEALDSYWLALMPTAKALACRLIAMLDEFEAGAPSADALEKLLFESDIDIEHIESCNPQEQEGRAPTPTEWEAELHRLGNLIVLERDKNRGAVSNHPYATVKRGHYKSSGFATVRRFAETYETWDLRQATTRKTKLATRIADYLCGPLR